MFGTIIDVSALAVNPLPLPPPPPAPNSLVRSGLLGGGYEYEYVLLVLPERNQYFWRKTKQKNLEITFGYVCVLLPF